MLQKHAICRVRKNLDVEIPSKSGAFFVSVCIAHTILYELAELDLPFSSVSIENFSLTSLLLYEIPSNSSHFTRLIPKNNCVFRTFLSVHGSMQRGE